MPRLHWPRNSNATKTLRLPDVAFTLRGPTEHETSGWRPWSPTCRCRRRPAGRRARQCHRRRADCPPGARPLPAGGVPVPRPGRPARRHGPRALRDRAGVRETLRPLRRRFRCRTGHRPAGRDVRRATAASLERCTDLAQPALFAVEYALAQLIESYGVHPDGAGRTQHRRTAAAARAPGCSTCRPPSRRSRCAHG